MIVVFVVDTSPSMGKKVDVSPSSSSSTGTNSITRLDLAKMTVESLTKSLDKRIRNASSATTNIGGQRSYVPPDQFLLLSTSRQERGGEHAVDSTAACAAGGRLLVGYGDSFSSTNPNNMMPGTGGGGGPNNNQWSSGDGNTGDGHQQAPSPTTMPTHNNHGGFEREIKRLNVAIVPDTPPSASAAPAAASSFPDHAGGAKGLNAALSQGLQLLQRYRLTFRATENFGLGRLPCAAMTAGGTAPNATNASGNQGGGSKQQAGGGISQQQMNANLTAVGQALQPACLILLTDAECLTTSPEKGGGDLKLQFGSLPLREFYKEPFRWDQRVFCLQIGSSALSSSSDISLPSSLRALCEVTGGGFVNMRSVSQLPYLIDTLIKTVAPPRPPMVPIPDPLRLPSLPHIAGLAPVIQPQPSGSVFLNGGPVCTFQPLERGMSGEPGPIHRAMLMQLPFQPPALLTSLDMGADAVNMSLMPPHILQDNNSASSNVNVVGSLAPPPMWCIPEAYWPSKKMDTLPPRQAQPLLQYSRSQGYQMIGSNNVDSLALMKLVHRYDQLLLLNKALATTANTQTAPPPVEGKRKVQQPTITAQARLLQRDVYVCEWLGKGDLKTSGQQREAARRVNHAPPSQPGQEYFSVGVTGAGRPSLTEGEGHGSNVLHMGVLHIPASSDSSSSPGGVSTLTVLPPDSHMLLPLLLKAAEAENRAMRKAIDKATAAAAASGDAQAAVGSSQIAAAAAAAGRSVFLDESWKTQFRAYLFRIPPFFQAPLRRALRPILPSNAHTLLSSDGMNAITSQCFSRACLQRIQKGEASAREMNDHYERSEEELRRRGVVDQQGAGEGPNAVASLQHPVIGYGQYDPRVSVTTYLNALRNMPPPWKVRGHPDYNLSQKMKRAREESINEVNSNSTREASSANASEESGDRSGDAEVKHSQMNEPLAVGRTASEVPLLDESKNEHDKEEEKNAPNASVA
jgi:hypothetical protein